MNIETSHVARCTSAIPTLRNAVLALQLAAASSAAFAQGSVASPDRLTGELGDVVVTGSRLPMTASGLAQSVTIIDRKQILESNPAGIEEALSRVNGLYVDKVGGAGGFSSVYVRGAEQSHVLIMVDGVKMNDATTTRGSAYDLSSIDLSQVERIEVLRGPASAVHGGEALAGVINIITRRSVRTGAHGSGYVAAGENGYGRIGGDLSFGSDTLRGQLRAGRSLDEAPDETGSLRLSSFAGSVRLVPNETVDGEIFATRTERKSTAFPDDSGGPRLAVNREKSWQESTDTTYGARFSAGDTRTVLVQAVASVYDRSEHADNAYIDAGVRQPFPAFVADTDFRRTTVNATATHDWGTRASLVVGAEYQIEEGSQASVGDFFGMGFPVSLDFRLERDTRSLFAEGRFQIARPLSLQVGLRRDSTEDVDSETTPNVGLVWSLPNGATALKASWSEGFKLPSFYALAHPLIGNPDLKPERSRNAELGLTHRLDARGSSLQVNVFRIDYEDLVDFDGDTFRMINRGTVLVRGIEPALDYRFSDRLRAQLGVTYLDIDERDGQAPLRNRPERKVTAGAFWALDPLSSLYAFVNYGSNFLDRSNPTGDIYLSGATTVDIGYSRRFGTFLARVAIDNLFDKDYEQFVGFPAQGRRFRAELRGTF